MMNRESLQKTVELTRDTLRTTSLYALRSLSRRPMLAASVVGVVALLFMLIGTIDLGLRNLRALSDGFQKEAQLTIYLADGTSAERMQKVADVLRKFPGVERVHQVPPKEAYERLRKGLGPHEQLLDGVEDTFLPASIEIKLSPGTADIFQLQPAYERLRKLPGVDGVEWSGDWLSRLLLAKRVVSRATSTARIFLLFGCLLLVASIIRVGVFLRRQEIAAYTLVGATHFFTRLPIIIEGAMVGALGAIVAAATLFVVYRLTAPRIETVLSNFLIAGHLQFFSFGYLLLATLGGLLFGTLASVLATTRLETTT